jgi:glycine/D-amino acid oxidase-like deaminating enzyme
VLLERDRLTSGTTWHAAGLMVTFGSTSGTSTSLRKYSRDLYSRLESETGLSTGFEPIGFIELATNPDYLEEFRRVADYNRLQGVDVQEIGPADVKQLFPLCRVDDVLRGFYVAGDGRVNPVDATMSLIKGARQQGAQVLEGVTVTEVLHANGQVTGVRTADGHDIQAEIVINCAGMWARQLAAKSGVSVPLQAAEHYYLITDPIPEVGRDWPVVEDPSSYTYIRREGAGLMVGLFEPWGAAWNVGAVPADFSFGEIPADWERMTPHLEKAMQRVPRTLDAGISNFFCGPESFTPDLRPIVGPAPELRNYWVAAGMNSIGILTGAGMGRLVAHWIMHGSADLDVTGTPCFQSPKPQASSPEPQRQLVAHG